MYTHSTISLLRSGKILNLVVHLGSIFGKICYIVSSVKLERIPLDQAEASRLSEVCQTYMKDDARTQSRNSIHLCVKEFVK